MSVLMNYQKRKNNSLFNKLQSNKSTNLSNIQNYSPIYERFFSLNSTNWNSINLNHQWHISDIKEIHNHTNIYLCKLKPDTDDDDISITQKVFIKYAPLLDPLRYVVGKYNHNDPSLFNLPMFGDNNKVHSKMKDPNNSSYIDGFFSYLSSKILHKYNFLNGIDYYGSFLGIKHNYKMNVADDIDYLIQSDFFNKHKNVLFEIEDYSHLIEQDLPKPLNPLNIAPSSLKTNLSLKSLQADIFEDIFENRPIGLDDLKELNINLIDLTNSTMFDFDKQKRSETLKSGSSCSSRTSHTNDEHINESDDEIMDDTSEIRSSECSYETLSDYNAGDEVVTLTLPKFPVQIICMENCENTLDYLMCNDMLDDNEWFSALMQIIMTLIAYQKMFSFTHNDLHTNNIMYVSTKRKYIYYMYKKTIYKVPTFGRIYKIIDFGRAIYKFQNKLFCSDDFQPNGYASTQYNTEPYMNENKPRLDPNFSFDLCRLGCSMFDFVVTDPEVISNKAHINNITSPFVKLIIEWCLDDNGTNMLYKTDGTDRYPDFKLYKMIARCVHKHTPQAQLERKEFSKYSIPKKGFPKGEELINIDDLPILI